MTNKDEQEDKALRDSLQGLDIPPPNPAARRKAIAMAREAFEGAQERVCDPAPEKNRIQSQGLLRWLRLMVENLFDRDKVMLPFSNRLMYSGTATAAIAIVAVGISLKDPSSDEGPNVARDLGTSGTTLDQIVVSGHRVTADSSDAEASLHSEDGLSGSPPVAMRLDASANLARKAEAPVALMRVRPDVSRLSMDLTRPPGIAAELDFSAAQSSSSVRGRTAYEPAPSAGDQYTGQDDFTAFDQNPVKLVSEEPISTFSADVDTASYSFVRRMLNQGVLPQGGAVRAEEMINYFDYDYALPVDRSAPFQPSVVISDAPWAEGRKLMHIGIKGFDIPSGDKPRTNLVFLLDVSGSMNSPDKLPLVKQSMELLLSTLAPDDTVAIAVYAGAAGTVLEPTPVQEKQKILDALRSLSAGGSTAGAQGIRLAYELAESRFDEGAINRVILATDGDFNVGISNERELRSFVERKRESEVYLSVLGFGQGNYKDALMQTLAQNGNGVAAYIDTLSEAQKLLVDEATSTLFPIAGDVKLQVEFNPAVVAEYRLIGYETRQLKREDFNNDAVDAGDIGAGHSVTAVYEFTPVGSDARLIDDSRYAPAAELRDASGSEYAFLKIRYKLPGADNSKLITRPVTAADALAMVDQRTGREAKFATAVAAFAQILKGGKHTGNYSYDDVIELAQQSKGSDPYGYRTEFIQLVRKAKTAAAMQAP
ncbi:MAG: von Willebrand factor type A domain-containing protein [Congregibacter sp.]